MKLLIIPFMVIGATATTATAGDHSHDTMKQHAKQHAEAVEKKHHKSKEWLERHNAKYHNDEKPKHVKVQVENMADKHAQTLSKKVDETKSEIQLGAETAEKQWWKIW